jgi:hypothetical protein
VKQTDIQSACYFQRKQYRAKHRPEIRRNSSRTRCHEHAPSQSGARRNPSKHRQSGTGMGHRGGDVSVRAFLAVHHAGTSSENDSDKFGTKGARGEIVTEARCAADDGLVGC